MNYNRLRGLSCRQWSKPERADQRGWQIYQEIGKNPKLQKQARSRERGKNSKNAILLTQWKTGRLDALYKDKLANWEGGRKTYYTEGLGTGETNQGNHKSKTMTFTLLKIKWEDWYISHMVNIRSSMNLFIYLLSSRWVSIFFKTIPVRNEATIVQIRERVSSLLFLIKCAYVSFPSMFQVSPCPVGSVKSHQIRPLQQLAASNSW